MTVGRHVAAEFGPTAHEPLTVFLSRADGDPLAQLDYALGFRQADRNLTADEVGSLEAAAARVRVTCRTLVSGSGRQSVM